MTPRAMALVAAAAAAASACDLEFVDPEEAGFRGELDGTVSVDLRDTTRIDAALRFQPGRYGRVLSDTVHVLGDALTPTGENGVGDRLYYATWSDPDLTVEAVVVELTPPALEGAVAPAPRPVGYTVAAAGPDTVMVERGRRVRLPLRRPPAAADLRPEIHRWSVGAAVGERSFSLTTEGAVPDTVIVPTDWLPDGFEGDLEAAVSVHQWTTLEPADDGVSVQIRLRTVVAWTVHVVEPASTAAPNRGTR